jgi:hypothetical protein
MSGLYAEFIEFEKCCRWWRSTTASS